MERDDLIKRLKAGDLKALDEAILIYSNIVFKVAYGVLGNRSHSEKIVNDVFIRMYVNVDKFNGDLNLFKNWLCTMSKGIASEKTKNIENEKEELSNVLEGGNENG